MGLDQPVHWVILLILAGLLFGGYKKLPEMARSAGRSMRVFKTELKGLEDDDQARANAAQPTAFPQPTAYTQPPAPAQPVAPAPTPAPTQPPAAVQYAPPVETAAPAAPAAPAAAAPTPGADQPAVTAQSAYVATDPVTDPSAPPRF